MWANVPGTTWRAEGRPTRPNTSAAGAHPCRLALCRHPLATIQRVFDHRRITKTGQTSAGSRCTHDCTLLLHIPTISSTSLSYYYFQNGRNCTNSNHINEYVGSSKTYKQLYSQVSPVTAPTRTDVRTVASLALRLSQIHYTYTIAFPSRVDRWRRYI